MAEVRVGISGWTYPPWRGVFYPKDLPHRKELQYAASRMNSVEINGSFYSLQRPSSYRSWFAETPHDFVFAVKGGRFITHMKKLAGVETPLANFFGSGVLALEHKLGPLLWQLPPMLHYDADRLAGFLRQLPRSTGEAAKLAERHDARLRYGAVTTTEDDRPLRHAVEVRHRSYETPEFVQLLRQHDIALVVADSAGRWPFLEDVTSDFTYVRLHGAQELYVSGYDDESLDWWAARVCAWTAGMSPADSHLAGPPAPHARAGRDVYVYFDNDVKVRAPFDAMALTRRVAAP
ncbi:MAG: DUF72 domain-containing protein [Jiangellaceae bacterium]|nr:DUF72 domain-containing protein [Jiangellaceae bacterium]